MTAAFSADTGFLSASSAVSDVTGKATATFSSGSSNPPSRTAAITATASGKSTQIPIRISKSTVTLASSATSLAVGGSPATLTVTVTSVSGAVLSGQSVAVASAGTGTVTLGAASGTTDSTGTFKTTVTPGTGGAVTLTVRTVAYTVSGALVAFQISAPATDPTAGSMSVPVAVSVTAPSPTTTVTFVAMLGMWDATGSSTVTKLVVGGVESANQVSTLTVAGTSISTDTSPSGPDAAVVIGGTAGSVTIGRATTVNVDPSGTLYILPMSVLVADANGNPVTNTTVSLSAWPIAFNANGTACSLLAANDYFNEDDVSATPTFFENLSLDAGEDGGRKRYPSETVVAGVPATRD